MIYILANLRKAYWEVPYIMIANCLKRVLLEKNINCEITNKIKLLKKEDICLLFQPYAKYDIKCKVIYINTESYVIRKEIVDQIKKLNVKYIFTYENKNYNFLKDKFNSIPIKIVPFLYNNYLEDLFNKYKKKKKDIDFLFYGFVNERRKIILEKLKSLGYNLIILNTNNIKMLIQHIKRSRIIIILHSYISDMKVDFYRINLLLSNKAFVIHESLSDLEKENYKLFDKIIYSDYNNFVDTCIKYIKLNQIDRNNISNDIYNWFKKNHSLSKYLPFEDILKIK
jgi:hypothetical protein